MFKYIYISLIYNILIVPLFSLMEKIELDLGTLRPENDLFLLVVL